jgi:hypothetical protein
MGRPLKIAKVEGSWFSNPAMLDGSTPETYGVVGGDTAIGGLQMLIRVRVEGEVEADGWIVRQKGSRKFLVEDAAGNRGVCILADIDDGELAQGEMTITAAFADSGFVRLSRVTNRWGIDFAGVKHILTFNAPDSDVNGYELIQVDSE